MKQGYILLPGLALALTGGVLQSGPPVGGETAGFSGIQ